MTPRLRRGEICNFAECLDILAENVIPHFVIPRQRYLAENVWITFLANECYLGMFFFGKIMLLVYAT